MATWASQNKNTASWTSQSQTQITTKAAAGLYYGFGAFTYSGGEILTVAPVVWGTQNKS